MKQIILIGFSTTGKTTLAKKIAEDNSNRKIFDTDKEIVRSFGREHISDIYYYYDKIDDSLETINNLEKEKLNALIDLPDNLIISAGPGIPLHDEFKRYVDLKRPHVVLLEKPAQEIYESLKDRRAKMKMKEEHQRDDFGKWDLEIMVKLENGKFIELDRIA